MLENPGRLPLYRLLANTEQFNLRKFMIETNEKLNQYIKQC